MVGIKSGMILHDVRGFVLDRVQSGGITNLNQPAERVYELVDFSGVQTILDIPNLTFSIESFDVTPTLEALTIGKQFSDITAGPGGTQIDLRSAMPLDVISPFRSGQNAFDIVDGVVIPYLTLESVQYRFGVGANTQQTFQYRGDTVNWVPGSPYYQSFSVTSGTNQTYTLNHTALPYVEGTDTLYALSVCAKNTTTGKSKRLFIGQHYTNTSTVVTVLEDLNAEGYTKLDVTYGSATAATYNANVNSPASTTKPGALRGKDVCVYVSDGAATPTMIKWDGIQTLDLQYRANLQALQELCNQKYVGQDFDTTDVTGSIVVRPSDPANLQSKVAQVANVASNVVAGPLTSHPLPMEIRLNDPDTGNTLKTLYVPDARITVPPMPGRVNQKLQATFNFQSDSGVVYVYNGLR